MIDSLIVGEKYPVELGGRHECGSTLLIRDEATYLGRILWDGVIKDMFEFDPPLRCTCGEEIAMWFSSAVDADPEAWEAALSDIEM